MCAERLETHSRAKSGVPAARRVAAGRVQAVPCVTEAARVPAAVWAAIRGVAGIAAALVLALPPAWAATRPDFLLAIFQNGAPSTWDRAVEKLTRSRVVFLGEHHEDPATHELELATLQVLRETDRPVVLSLEMFETDVQEHLDAYLAGTITEKEFLAKARPWKNYRDDYRPLIEFARAHGIGVVAGNVPRRLAGKTAKEGLVGLEALPPEDRRWARIPDACPADRGWERFKEIALEHPGATTEMAWKLYEAQCLKDATMAGSIAAALARKGEPVVLHINGAFHSDFGDGVPAKLRLLAPWATQLRLTVRPTDSAPVALPDDLAGAADITAFVQAPFEAAAEAPVGAPASPSPVP